ncbi:hypothetical protein BKA63DRAFT_221918 [Paraphoma chrysanthemicola]|nr:hypothetical protein BKA63DRAFT_221918 [Paraphoma chrysanthemicola]
MSCGGNSSLEPCGGALPSDFCCPQQTNCLPFYIERRVYPDTAVCCPRDRYCEDVSPIENANLLNASLHPDFYIHSILDNDLSKCADGFCPPGYVCQRQFGSCHILNSALGSGSRPELVRSSTSSGITFTNTYVPSASNGTPNDGGVKVAAYVIAIAAVVGGIVLIILISLAMLFVRRSGLLPKRLQRKEKGMVTTEVQNEKGDEVTQPSESAALSGGNVAKREGRRRNSMDITPVER